MSKGSAQSRRTFLKAAGSATAAVALAGCLGGNGGNGGNGTNNKDKTDDGGKKLSGRLVFARGAPSPTLDPQNTKSGEVRKVTNQLYDKLIRFKPGKTSLEDGLATEYNLEGTTATLTLRKGVKFTNGEEFTAQDFKATYRRYTDPKYEHYPGKKNLVPSYAKATYGQVKEVTVKEEYTLEIELKKKYAPFLRNLAMFSAAVHSEKAIKEKGTKLNTEPVGTGPFKLGAFRNNGQRIQLIANEQYWGKKGPNVKQVVFDTIGENSTRAANLKAGKAHIIDGLGTSSSQQVKQAGNTKLIEFEGMNVGYMAYNMARFEPFRKKKVRQALSYAINTKAIVEQIFSGFATQASQLIPSNVLGYNKDLDPYPHDVTKAKQLLKEAGHGDGFEIELATFKNPRGYNPSPQDAANQIRSDLKAIGVTATIKPMPWESFLNYTTTGKHDACFLGWYSDNGDPDNFYYSLFHPGIPAEKIPEGQDWVSFDTKEYNTLNVSAWANREFMDVVEQGQATYEESERKELYQKAAKIAYEESPCLFINHSKGLRGVSKKVSGYIPATIGGPYLHLVSLKE